MEEIYREKDSEKRQQREFLKNFDIMEYKFFIVLVFLVILFLHYVDTLTVNFVYYALGGIGILILISVMGKRESSLAISANMAKGIVLNDLTEKKKSGSNEYGLQTGVPKVTGEFSAYPNITRQVAWAIPWVLIDDVLGTEKKYISEVDVKTGQIKVTKKSLVGTTYRTRGIRDVDELKKMLEKISRGIK